jgi:hypothetical protein
MTIARSLAPSAASARGGKPAQAASAPLVGALDEEAQVILFMDGNRGELPGEYSRRPQLVSDDEQSESPYWATWGF